MKIYSKKYTKKYSTCVEHFLNVTDSICLKINLKICFSLSSEFDLFLGIFGTFKFKYPSKKFKTLNNWIFYLIIPIICKICLTGLLIDKKNCYLKTWTRFEFEKANPKNLVSSLANKLVTWVKETEIYLIFNAKFWDYYDSCGIKKEFNKRFSENFMFDVTETVKI